MVKMLISTSYDGKRYEKDKSYPINLEVEKRWIKNKIAEKELDLFLQDKNDDSEAKTKRKKNKTTEN